MAHSLEIRVPLVDAQLLQQSAPILVRRRDREKYLDHRQGMGRLRVRHFFAAAAMAAPMISGPVMADCSNQSGFMYVWETCIQEEVSGKPRNICEVKKGKDTKEVLFTSNVIYDRADNDRYPSSIFFDEIELQHSVTINGRESHCYASRREAEDDLREFKADRKRSARGELILVTVSMPDT